MPAAGETIIAGRIPGERIATTIATSSSSSITTTETVILSVTAPLVIGRVYRVVTDFGWDLTVANDDFVPRIREDSVTGNTIQARRLASANTNIFLPAYMETEFTAVSTGDKTFVVAVVRAGGTGSFTMQASATQPAFLYVDYIRG